MILLLLSIIPLLLGARFIQRGRFWRSEIKRTEEAYYANMDIAAGTPYWEECWLYATVAGILGALGIALGSILLVLGIITII